jgi:hypothetical protein
MEVFVARFEGLLYGQEEESLLHAAGRFVQLSLWEGGKGARACSCCNSQGRAPRPSFPPPLSLYLYLLLNEVGYLGAGQRLSLSSFWVILDWFLF